MAGLVLRGLRKRFGDTVALDGVDLAVEPGRLLGLLGPNGAGKTTTMRAVLRLVDLDAGDVTWDGAPLDEAARRSIGYLPQERGLYVRMRVHEQVAWFGRLAGMSRADAATQADRWIERVGLADRREDLVQALSVGNQQRVQLALALIHRPLLLVFDEPFAGLDPVAVATLSSIMTEQVASGVAVVFSSHQLDLVQDLCEDVCIIARGRTVATGTVAGLRSSSNDRFVDISWEDPAVQWVPVGAVEHGERRPGRSRFVVDADTDPAALVASAAAQGRVTGIRFEPPALDQVFLELVGAGPGDPEPPAAEARIEAADPS